MAELWKQMVLNKKAVGHDRCQWRQKRDSCDLGQLRREHVWSIWRQTEPQIRIAVEHNWTWQTQKCSACHTGMTSLIKLLSYFLTRASSSSNRAYQVQANTEQKTNNKHTACLQSVSKVTCSCFNHTFAIKEIVHSCNCPMHYDFWEPHLQMKKAITRTPTSNHKESADNYVAQSLTICWPRLSSATILL